MTTLAANFNGPISYTDKTALTVGIVGDSFSGMTSTGITSSSNDVKLTAGGDLAINQAVNTGSANLTLSDTGNVTQGASGVIAAGGLQLLGSGSVHLDNPNNDVTTLAANFSGPISYTDKTALTVGTVGTSVGITTGGAADGGSVTIHSGGVLTVDQVIDTTPGSGGVVTVSNAILNAALIAGAGDITLNGGGQDLIINVDQSSNTTLTYSADRDIIIRATITANGSTSDIRLEADADNDGIGGVWLNETHGATNAQLVAGRDITILGSDLFATPSVADSIVIDADGERTIAGWSRCLVDGQGDLGLRYNAHDERRHFR